MTLNQKYEAIINYFLQNAENSNSELHFENSFQLLIAVILSAQCTDKRVNLVTPALFEKFPDANSLAQSSFEEVFSLIKSISYPNNKATHLIGMAKKLVEDFGSEVPQNVEQLMTLPGVGRKTANVVASICFGKEVIAVDTHIFRVSHRLGLSLGTSPRAVELDLENNIPKQYRATAHHWLLLHGRYICTARNPKCSICGLSAYCSHCE